MPWQDTITRLPVEETRLHPILRQHMDVRMEPMRGSELSDFRAAGGPGRKRQVGPQSLSTQGIDY